MALLPLFVIARPLRSRIHIDGLPLHSVQRGHNRAPCFLEDQDRTAYLGWLGEALARERCRLHAYVLMTNHVHLLLTPEQAVLLLGEHDGDASTSAACGLVAVAQSGTSRPSLSNRSGIS